MALVVDRIECIEESDELGSDTIYLMVFQGRTGLPFASGLNIRGPGPAWGSFDTGDVGNWDVRAASTHADAVYAVMMVEADYVPDFWDSQPAWREKTDWVWKVLMLEMVADGIPTDTVPAKFLGFSRIREALNGLASKYLHDEGGVFQDTDDVIDVKRVTITSPGQSQTLRFRSNKEDATYDVTFKHTNDP